MQLQSIIVIFHVLVAIMLVGLILIQRGKGAEAGAACGAGASQTAVGSRCSASFLPRLTAILAPIFFITSLSLAYFTQQGKQRQGVTEIAAPAKGSNTGIQTDVPSLPMSEQTETVTE
mgnify:CR=1 FL=1